MMNAEFNHENYKKTDIKRGFRGICTFRGSKPFRNFRVFRG